VPITCGDRKAKWRVSNRRLSRELDGDLRPVSSSVTAVRRIEPLELSQPLVAHRRKDLMWP
jgi:hypothetical protein